MSKKIILCITSTIVCYMLQAQTAEYKDYTVQTGEFAGIYSGQIKADYNRLFYENTPYYYPDFTKADVVYKGNLYAGQQILLDLFREQAIIMTPEKYFGIVMDSENTDTIRFQYATFVWLRPGDESNLHNGFYRVIYDGLQIKILCKIKYSISNTELLKQFNITKRYYLWRSDKYYAVKNKRSFIKLFPEYKKMINQYNKRVRTDFKNEADRSMSQLAAYCEDLLQTGGAKQ